MTKKAIYSLIIFNHLWVLFGFIVFDFDWKWASISLLGILLIGKLGGEAGFHRYFCHKSFKLKVIPEFIVLYLGCLNCFGSPISWSVIHSSHHIYSDTRGDPHGSLPWWKVWLTVWRQPSISRNLIAKYSKNQNAQWLHRNYFPVVILSFIVLTLFNPLLSLFFISVPAIISFHSAGLVNTVCHRFGYRNFDTEDGSFNNLFVNLITLGSGLHNNHHKYPSSWNNSHAWYEVDIVSWMIFLIKSRDPKGSPS